MKNTNKLLSLVLALAIILGTVSVIGLSASAEKTAQSVYWSYDNGTDTLTISDSPASGRQEFTVDAQRWADVYTMPWNIAGKWYSNVKTVVIDGNPRPVSTSRWFANAHNLTEIVNLKNLDTSCVEDMSSMFNSCTKLTEIDLSNFDTSKVTSFFAMFTTCIKVQSLDLSSFDTSLAKSFVAMFSDCAELKKLDVSSFDVGNVEQLDDMFGMCMSLEEINLFAKPSKITSVKRMFAGCENLTTITAPCDSDWAGVYGSFCFESCNSLVGENGTAYVDYTYYGDFLHFDGGSENPGYLTKAHAFTETVDSQYLKSDANCVSAAVYYKSCSRCAQTSETETFTNGEALGHNLTYNARSEATCTHTGNIEYWRCSRCTGIFLDSEATVPYYDRVVITIKPNVHNWDEGVVTTNPTCTTAGEKTFTCLYNSEHKRTEPIDPTGHTPGAPVKENEVPATCTSGGSYEDVVYCTVCSRELSRNTVAVAAKGHTDSDNDGKCDDCRELMTGKGHCSFCGKIHDMKTPVGFFTAAWHNILYVCKNICRKTISFISGLFPINK